MESKIRKLLKEYGASEKEIENFMNDLANDENNDEKHYIKYLDFCIIEYNKDDANKAELFAEIIRTLPKITYYSPYIIEFNADMAEDAIDELLKKNHYNFVKTTKESKSLLTSIWFLPLMLSNEYDKVALQVYTKRETIPESLSKHIRKMSFNELVGEAYANKTSFLERAGGVQINVDDRNFITITFDVLKCIYEKSDTNIA